MRATPRKFEIRKKKNESRPIEAKSRCISSTFEKISNPIMLVRHIDVPKRRMKALLEKR